MRNNPLSLGRAVVCVPARNEAEVLPRLVRSLDRQIGSGDGALLRVVILANNCTDETVSLIREMERNGETRHLDLRVIEAVVPREVAHVGTARRMALDAGADWLDSDGVEDAVLLSTDADAVAAPGWARANLAALENSELVGGRLVIETEESENRDPEIHALHRRIEQYWVAVRALEEAIDPPAHDPAPRHGDHVAASLALRAALYREVGGLPAIPCGEDNALVAKVRLAGGRVRHCPHVSISVSDRGTGRVTGGMATEMARRARVVAGVEEYRLPPASHWLAVIERQRAFRLAWSAKGGPEAGLRALGVSAEDIAAIQPGTCVNAIAFAERVGERVGDIGPEPAHVPLDEAIAGLDALLARLIDRRTARVA
ncbi:glycosyltransferase family 2 protein [Methylobacterium sp. CM6247]